jgi:hypothetical protein
VTPCRKTMCKTCVFAPGNPVHLTAARHGEIREYLLRGTPHLCHTPGPNGRPDELACRGGRNLQLEVWARLGIIAAATDDALLAAMRTAGVDPEKGAS